MIYHRFFLICVCVCTGTCGIHRNGNSEDERIRPFVCFEARPTGSVPGLPGE